MSRRICSRFAFMCLAAALVVSAASAQVDTMRDRALILQLLQSGDVDLDPEIALALPSKHSALKIRRIGLNLEGQSIRAAFRDKTVRMPASHKVNVRYLDAYYNELAAYVVARELGLDLVPPTVLREVGIAASGLKPSSRPRQGSLQFWVENALVEHELVTGKHAYPGSRRLKNEQLSEILVFDCIIGNTDRHAGNILIDFNPRYPVDSSPEPQEPLLGKLWAIDHSRSFHASSRLKSVTCRLNALAARPVSGVFFEGMRNWDTTRVEAALQQAGLTEEQLANLHLDAVEERLAQVLDQLETMQRDRGLSDEEFFSDGAWHHVR
jgi:hypothetical protein